MHGDSEQTLRVLVSYYRQKTESLLSEMNTISKSKATIIPDQINNDSDKLLELITIELGDNRTNMFAGWVEGIYATCLAQHFSTWHDPSLPLVESIQIESILNTFESKFPVCSSVLSIGTKAGGNNFLAKRKRYLILHHFLSMCRHKNMKLLTTWAMVEGISQIARGIPRIANNASVMRRYSLTYPTIFRKQIDSYGTIC